jgi:hypothetical protein
MRNNLIILVLILFSIPTFAQSVLTFNSEKHHELLLEKPDFLTTNHGNGLMFINPVQSMFLFQIPDDSLSICMQARIDANTNFTGRGAFWGSYCVTGGCNPLFGVITAGITASKPPKEEKLGITNYELAKDPIYLECYRSEAHSIKKKQAWTGFGLGVATYAVLLVINFSMQQ